MGEHGTLRFERNDQTRPASWWVVAVAALLTLIVAVGALLLLLPSRWVETGQVRAPAPVSGNRVGSYLDTIEALASRPSAQAEAARSVGVEPGSIDVTVSRPELDVLGIEVVAPSKRQASGTLTALVRVGLDAAGAREQDQADLEALSGLEAVEVADVVNTTRSAQWIDWKVVLAAGLILATGAAVVTAHLEHARMMRGHERTPELVEIRTRAAADEVTARDPERPGPGAPTRSHPVGRRRRRADARVSTAFRG